MAMSFIVDGCMVTCGGCGRANAHPRPLEQAVETYAGGRCPSCGSDEVFGEDAEVPLCIDPQAQDHSATLAALATYAKEATHG